MPRLRSLRPPSSAFALKQERIQSQLVQRNVNGTLNLCRNNTKRKARLSVGLRLFAVFLPPEDGSESERAGSQPSRRGDKAFRSSFSSSSTPEESDWPPEDDEEEEETDEAVLDAEQELLADITERYETWKSQALRKSLSAMRGGEEIYLDAYDLNERFRPDYWQRLRIVLEPEEAFANIFKLEGVMSANAHALEYAAWKQLADELGKESPDRDIVQQAYHLRPERIVQGILRWTDNWREIKEIVYRQHEIYRERFLAEQHQPRAGLLNWLELLQRYDMPCVVFSRMDRLSVEKALADLGVESFFPIRITAEDEVETAVQYLLVACMKLKRAPQKCVVYEDTPRGILAAHEVFSKAVALVGLFPAFDLRAADLTVEDFEELRVMNVRRLFADQEEPAPQFELDRFR
jgi:beta-phosphoglucomutase-like phosphatase (HAD superfamily)